MSLVGISFPFRKSKGEFPKKDCDQEAVRSNVIALFNLALRGRVMRPELGTTVYSMIFDPITPLLIARLERAVRSTLERGEPRAKVVNLNVSSSNTQIIIDILYEVAGVEDTATITFPKGA